ncbi:UTP--glucose-1-phosphate uridylyltransferase GalU [Desulfallas sp. Bu1-1]|uniref:UTP--glucose-1-phosphate uridylyltransferase GalU n=1 Tax=Desulfallas sp. Bu1-1 TaxID=2787620 RepID=UPI00189E91E3|nr:UTP--glucose-1-phosphate uridylyltransferase GalU [Desulfallas sp. Bu1-1]MBF7081619.1 UTP--glucose-1-phosphate uridylyltransferase GalU [Desulfallas sp. Bu1-1]
MKIRKAVIPAAGLGVRFLPATKALPKEMIPIVDKPTIQYIIEEAVNSGIEDILIITGRDKKAIEDHFDKSRILEDHLRSKGKKDLLEIVKQTSSLADIHYVRQKEPRGLGHAVYCARRFVGNEPFAVLLGDDVVRGEVPCLKQMMDLYEQVQASVIGVQEVPLADVSKYGIIDAAPFKDNIFRIHSLVEKPAPEQAPSRLAIMGRYIIEPEIFEILARTGPGAGGEIQLTDALKVLAGQKEMYGLVFEGKRYDVGDKLGYLKAMVEFALARPDLAEEFRRYLEEIVVEKDTV